VVITARIRAALSALLPAMGLISGMMARLPAQAALFTPERYLELERASSPVVSPDGKTIVFTRRAVDRTADRWTSAIWAMDADGGHLRPVTAGRAPQWSPDGDRIAYLATHDDSTQLFVHFMDGNRGTVQLTHGANAPDAFVWAPDGQAVVFTRAEADSGRWEVTRRNHLFVVPAWGGTPTELTPGAFDAGAPMSDGSRHATISWLADGRTMVIDGVDSAGEGARSSNLYGIDIGGAIRRLTTDSGDWHGAAVSPDGKWIAYVGHPSSADFHHTSDVYLMAPNGTGVRNLTAGLDRVPRMLHWSPDKQTVWFEAEDHGSVNLWTVDINPKKPGARPATNGTHVLSLGAISPRDNYGVVARSTPSAPADIYRFALNKPWQLDQLTHFGDNALRGIPLGDMEEVDWDVGEASLQGWVIKPPGFDPNGKYPLFVDLHGGVGRMANVGFDAARQVMAAAGYLVFFLNPRGSSGYGAKFGNAVRDSFPELPFGDVMAGVSEVAGRGWVDTTRMYIGGCGAVLAEWAITRTDRFAAAAVGCGDGDGGPAITGVLFSRPFGAAGWAAHLPLADAGKITTPTLFLVGPTSESPWPGPESIHAVLRARGIPAALVRLRSIASGATARPSSWMTAQRAVLDWFAGRARRP
jgi:dipeptidyl aminopeptidase/acylaminoacyl peptidase